MSRNRKKSIVPCHSSVQSLETRQLLAGDVTVALSSIDSRDLVITGDNSSNQILVEEIGVDRIRVTGQDGTRINGGTNSVTLTVRDDVTIDMNGGNDRVTVRNLNLQNYSHSDMNIDLGTGHDTLEVLATDVARHLNVYAGDGNDSLTISESTATDLLVDGEYGDDTITIDELTTASSATIDGGEDDDEVLVKDSVIGNDLIIDTDAGADEAVVAGVDVADNISLQLGSGDDYGVVRYSDADDVFVYGHTGDDTVYLYQNKVTDQLYASLSSGNDDLHFWSNSVGRHYFNGGTGTDTWSTVLDYFWTWSNFYNFE